MKEITKGLFKIDLFSSILYLSLGLLLFLVPSDVLKTISVVIGAIILSSGVVPIVNYFKESGTYFKTTNLIAGIILIVSGLVLIVHSSLLETVIAIIIGVTMIINSISKIEYTLNLRDNKVDGWVISMVFAILTLLVGIFFVVNSFVAMTIITKTLGLIIIIYTIIDITTIVTLKLKFNKVIKETDNIKVIDAKWLLFF